MRVTASEEVVSSPVTQIVTIKIRLRDKHSSGLSRQAKAVNICWNYCNDIQQKAARARRPWLSYYELAGLTAGAGKELDLHAHTVQRVCRYFYESRRAGNRPWLRWRGRKSLGWVPFNTGHMRFDGRFFIFRGVRYEPMHHHKDLSQGMKLGAGSFNADSKGRWYINVPIEVECAPSSYEKVVGIDLGLKTLATLSTGERLVMPRFYRDSEEALAKNQRARKAKKVRAIHAKARNRRRDFMHKATLIVAKEFGTIIVGDVSSKRLAKTPMAKSVYDAGWSGFKSMLLYKSMRNGGRMVEASEVNTSRTCSCCGSIPSSSPKGMGALRIREWECSDCGAVHDRDVNAAVNILRVGLDTLVEGAQQ